MKDYERIVVWPDYFNKGLTKAQGRRLSRSKCVFDPILPELEEAVAAAGLQAVASNEKARHPRRPYARPGCIVLPKSPPKSAVLNRISGQLRARRAKKSR
jgi:signal recognition particle subunit SEC65